MLSLPWKGLSDEKRRGPKQLLRQPLPWCWALLLGETGALAPVRGWVVPTALMSKPQARREQMTVRERYLKEVLFEWCRAQIESDVAPEAVENIADKFVKDAMVDLDNAVQHNLLKWKHKDLSRYDGS